MPYTETNYRSKKALKEDVAAGKEVRVYQPGPFGPDVRNGACCIEGPHYPEPHRWYASVIVQDGVIVKFVR